MNAGAVLARLNGVPFFVEDRPPLNLKASLELALSRKVSEVDRFQDARFEKGRWVIVPGAAPRFTAQDFVAGTLSRLTRKAAEDQKDVFLGKRESEARLGPLEGSFLMGALQRMGSQMVGEPDGKTPWTVKWVDRDVVTQVVCGRTIRSETGPFGKAVAISTEWDIAPRKGLDAPVRAKLTKAHGNGWVWLDSQDGRPLGWRIPWVIDLPLGRGRLEVLDELSLEPVR